MTLVLGVPYADILRTMIGAWWEVETEGQGREDVPAAEVAGMDLNRG